MGRAPRAIDSERIYHAFSRGSNRGRIVWDAHDCENYLAELGRVATKYEWDVYAWVLMPNHHHAVLRTTQEQFSDGFQQLNGNHSRRTNRRHDRSAHLFKGRPEAVEIESEAHLIGCIAYVVRNPVKAELVTHAGEWPWSSYRATMGLEWSPPWLRIDEVLPLFGRTPERARHAFDELVHLGHLPVPDTEDPSAPREAALATT